MNYYSSSDDDTQDTYQSYCCRLCNRDFVSGTALIQHYSTGRTRTDISFASRAKDISRHGMLVKHTGVKAEFAIILSVAAVA